MFKNRPEGDRFKEAGVLPIVIFPFWTARTILCFFAAIVQYQSLQCGSVSDTVSNSLATSKDVSVHLM